MSGNPRKHKILSVSYDEPLLVTRQLVLEQSGYEVISALGFSEGMERCHEGCYELVIIGHSIPRKDQNELLKAAKEHCKAQVLSIRRHGDLPHPNADFSVDSLDGPQVLINEVHKAFTPARPAK